MPSIPQLAQGPQIIVQPTLEELVALHLENEAFGVRGETIFEGPLSDGGPFPDACIGVLEAVGGDLEPLAGPDAPDLGTVRVQVMLRAAKNAYTAGKKTAEQICTALHKSELGGDVFACFADTPFYVTKQRSGRHLFAINLTIKTHGTR